MRTLAQRLAEASRHDYATHLAVIAKAYTGDDRLRLDRMVARIREGKPVSSAMLNHFGVGGKYRMDTNRARLLYLLALYELCSLLLHQNSDLVYGDEAEDLIPEIAATVLAQDEA